MEEKTLENKLQLEIKKRNGQAIKMYGLAGIPDRLILLPGGRIAFIELKAPEKRPRKLQEHRAEELRQLGFTVCCIDSKDKLEEFLREIDRGGDA